MHLHVIKINVTKKLPIIVGVRPNKLKYVCLTRKVFILPWLILRHCLYSKKMRTSKLKSILVKYKNVQGKSH